MTDRPTSLLLRQAQQGDRAAFDELASEQRSHLESVVRLRLGAHLRRLAGVDDIIQETLTKAWSSLKRFRPGDDSSFRRWLEAIAEHTILALARKHRREHLVCFDDEPVTEGTPPSTAKRREERFDRLEDALRSLSTDHRQVIVLARIEGLPVRDVAKRMGRTPNAVSLLLVRALRELKRRFGETESFHLPPRRLDETLRENLVEGDAHDAPGAS